MSTKNHDSMSRRMFLDSTAKAGAMAFAAGVTPLAPAMAGADEPGKWLNGVYRQLHIDAHFGGFKTIYRDFDAEACAQSFADAGVQMVSYFAKCWAGYSYYPTKIGTVHPGLDRDFTGELTAALKKRGIRRIVYFMLGMERRCQKEHPEWIRNTDSTQRIFAPEAISDAAMMCFNSPYVDQYGIPQMKEIMSLYDIDGFFVDIVMQQFLQSNCFCKNCRESYEREVGGPMPTDDADPKAFRYRRWANRHMEAHMEKVQRALAAVDPDITIINNYAWMFRYPVTPPGYVHHITWDTPVPKVGNYAWNFSLEARYVSTLPGITWSCMNTRGNTWGEYSFREPEAFLDECATLLASCGRTYLSDIPYPHGNPDPAVMKVFGEVNRRTRELEPYLRDCRPVPDVAVLHAADSVWSKAPMKPTPTWQAPPAYYSVCGAHKALIEGHCQMAILNSDRLPEAIDDCGALILPDQRILGETECAAIRSFVKNGGALIVTGGTGIRDADNRALANFALSDVLGVDYLG
ncbi:MAG: alpha-L-fucosidase, partial [Candidatus Latescibacteria bacterium]|nr:alpha-L-fucosidase [Candidatus Latescibacterota bacterium]